MENRLARLRRAKGLTQEQLAERLGIKDRSRICELERRALPQRLVRLYAAAVALGATVDDLIGGAEVR
jgi:transcriptional regulator with XRE-family HTH domain